MGFFSNRFSRILNGSAHRLGDVVNDLAGTVVAVGPTSGTPNTNLTVAHGLADPVTGLGAVPYAANVQTGNLYIVSFDATNVVVASTAATQSGTVRLFTMPSDHYTGPRKQ